MPRGKNYVNNNKGVSLMAPKKEHDRMPACQYGSACTRSDCIYRHDDASTASIKQSLEPCMPFLAGQCAFTNKTCRKRHPPKVEAQRLIVKYKSTKCRFGANCRTNACLYIHPGDDREGGVVNGGAFHHFPPLTAAGGQQQQQAQSQQSTTRLPPNSAWKTSLPRVTPSANAPVGTTTTSRTGSLSFPAAGVATTSDSTTASQQQGDKLNVNAKEFVPGGGGWS